MNRPTYPLLRCLTCGHLQTFSSDLVHGGRAIGWCVGGHQAEFAATSGSETATCGECGGVMVFNVPRLGPSGGYVHARTGKLLCQCPKCGSGERSALGTHCADCFFEFPNLSAEPGTWEVSTKSIAPGRAEGE